MSLSGKICCVTGASRGIGRGIALGLAERGATIYVTGRSFDEKSVTDKTVGGNLANLVKEIQMLGGKGIAVQVDHSDEEQVKALFEKIDTDSGKLDLLVNNAFKVPVPPSGVYDPDILFNDFWDQPGWFWDSFNNVGLRSHYITSCHAYPVLKKAVSVNEKRPLIVHISSFGGISYSFNVAYGVGKAGVDRMAKDMHRELQPHGISCVSLYPGVVRTERMVSMLDSNEWKEKTGLATPKRFIESPMLTGKVIAALYENNDRYLDTVGGKVCVTAEVAKRYNIVDNISGITPPSIRSLKFLVPSIALANIENSNEFIENLLISITPDFLLPMFLMQGGAPSSPKDIS